MKFIFINKIYYFTFLFLCVISCRKIHHRIKFNIFSCFMILLFFRYFMMMISRAKFKINFISFLLVRALCIECELSLQYIHKNIMPPVLLRALQTILTFNEFLLKVDFPFFHQTIFLHRSELFVA